MERKIERQGETEIERQGGRDRIRGGGDKGGLSLYWESR